jgi:hypothetical protein
MLELTEFQSKVVQALEKQDLTEVRYVGRARNRRCERDGVRLEKFRGFKDRVPWVAYACPNPKCRHAHMKSLVLLKPIVVEL